MGKSLDIIKAPRQKPISPATVADSKHEKNKDDFFPHEPPTREDPLLFYLILGLCAIILLIVLSVALVYKTIRTPSATDTSQTTDQAAGNSESTEAIPADTMTETTDTNTTATAEEAANPTEAAPSIDKAALVIRVLNGNGRTGEAALMAQTLKDAGFTNVTTGNTLSRYKTTVIYHKAGKVPAARAVQEVIASKYQNISLLENESIAGSSDIVVALGE